MTASSWPRRSPFPIGAIRPHGALVGRPRACARWSSGRVCEGAEIDGLSLSSFTLGPDTAVGLTQHLGLRRAGSITCRWAAPAAWWRCAARRARCRRRCRDRGLRRRRHQPRRFVPPHAVDLQPLRARRRLSLRLGRPERELRADHRATTCGTTARRARISARSASRSAPMRCRIPHALFKKPLTLDEYLGARPISDPIHLFDCVMPCAGAEAFLVMREDAARGAGPARARLLGTIERHNAFPDDPIQMRGGWALDRDELYAQAGVDRPTTSISSQTYDDYPVICMMQFEDLGFCAKGEGPDVRPRAHAHRRRQLPASTPPAASCRSARPARPAAFSAWSRRSASSPARRSARQVPDAEARPGPRLRHDQLRPRPVQRRRDPGGRPRMTEPLSRPSARTRS